MRPPDSSFWSRAAAAALLAVLWLALGARPARAQGCHVADRPTLGLTFAWETPSARVPAAHSAIQPVPLVQRPPCSQAVPGPKAPEVSASTGALLLLAATSAPGLAESLATIPNPRASRLVAYRLDRPPRAA